MQTVAMKTMPAIAVIGCGYWGKNHIRTWSELGALKAVADVDAARSAGLDLSIRVAQPSRETIDSFFALQQRGYI